MKAKVFTDIASSRDERRLQKKAKVFCLRHAFCEFMGEAKAKMLGEKLDAPLPIVKPTHPNKKKSINACLPQIWQQTKRFKNPLPDYQ